MSEKGLLFFIVLSIGLIALFAYLGVKTYKELQDHPAAKTAPAATPQTPPAVSRPALPQAPDPTAPGREAYRRGDYSAALEAFKQALAANPDRQDIQGFVGGADAMLRVQVAMLSRKWDDALAACREATKYDISSADANQRMAEIGQMKEYHELYEMARQTADQGDYAKATGQYREAGRRAERLRLTTDAPQKAREMEKLAEQSTAAGASRDALLSECTQRNDAYATFAAATFYLSDPLHKPRQQEIQRQLETAKACISGNRAKYPSPRVAAAIQFDVVKKNNGEEIKGQLLTRDDKLVKLRQEKDGKALTRTILASDVAEVKKETITPESVNEAKAEEVLQQALKALETKKMLTVLTTLGMLLYEFPDVPLMKNPERQKQIIAASSMAAAMVEGGDVQKLLQVCVSKSERACPKCSGSGKLPCATCKGTGKIETPCPNCQGSGKMMCQFCGGQGRVPGQQGTNLVRCATCGGKGTLKCSQCDGKKIIVEPCRAWPDEMMPCDQCGGTGNIR